MTLPDSEAHNAAAVRETIRREQLPTPSILIFGVNETLLDLRSLGAR